MLMLVFGTLAAQQEAVSVRGRVSSKEGEPLFGTNIIVKETSRGATTDENGHYTIRNLPPGTYSIEFSFIGYEKAARSVVIRAGQTLSLDITLESTAFKIGEMEVVAERPLIPITPETKTTISSAEIEHIQASSVGDVLDIVPGIQKTANPGLGKTLQVGIRGEQSDPLTAFGTKVMVDGVPLSNNANMQFEKWTAAITGVSGVGGGVDLRMIPADNLENIEVFRGIPSVRYGELSSGLINIKTKTGIQPHRLKVKTNPDTKEANFGGGFGWQESEWSYNANVARSERNIRLVGDEYTRLTGQVVASTKLMDKTLTLTNKVFGQKVFDEEQPKGDAAQIHNYNRGYGINYALTGNWRADPSSSVDFNAYVNYHRENSMRSKLVQGSLRILPNGDTISSYLGKVNTVGDEWTLGGRAEWQRTWMPGDFVHQFLVGAEAQYDANTGEGVLIDSVYNYYGVESGRGSYRFDDVPGQLTLSLYAEDKITGNLLVDFSWVFGARYEMYGPQGVNFSGLLGKADFIRARHGSYLNPRTSLILYFAKGSQARLSAGMVSKSPPMSTVYAPPDVQRWRNPVDSVVQYFRYDRWATSLRAYREQQVELGFDQTIAGLAGVSLSAYYKHRYDQPDGVDVPVFYSMTKDNRSYLWYVDLNSQTLNAGWNVSKGIEVSIRSKRIEPLNLDFTIVGSFNYVRSGSNSMSFDATPDPSLGQTSNFPVRFGTSDTLYGLMYPSSGRWIETFLFNYYIRYTVASLGLWATLRIEHQIGKRWQYTTLEPVDYGKLSESAKLNRAFDEGVRSEPSKWLVNLNLSKSLFRGAEVSFYVNNFFDDPAVYQYQSSYDQYAESTRNPNLFYGLEFSISIDAMFK